jgi:hypothetical protein
MSTYQVDTEDGTYEVEVDDGPSNESSASPGWLDYGTKAAANLVGGPILGELISGDKKRAEGIDTPLSLGSVLKDVKETPGALWGAAKSIPTGLSNLAYAPWDLANLGADAVAQGLNATLGTNIPAQETNYKRLESTARGAGSLASGIAGSVLGSGAGPVGTIVGGAGGLEAFNKLNQLTGSDTPTSLNEDVANLRRNIVQGGVTYGATKGAGAALKGAANIGEDISSAMDRKSLGARASDYGKASDIRTIETPEGVVTPVRAALDDLLQNNKLGTSRNPSAILSKIDEASGQIGSKIGETINKFDETNKSPVRPEFDHALEYLSSGKVPADLVPQYLNRLSNLEEAIIKEGQGKLGYLQQQKVAFGKSWDPADQVKSGFDRAIYSDLKQSIESNVPEVKALNKELAKYKIAEPIVLRSLKQSEAQSPLTKIRDVAYTTGGIGAPTIIGSLLGGPAGAVLGAGAGLGGKLLATPTGQAALARGLRSGASKAASVGSALDKASAISQIFGSLNPRMPSDIGNIETIFGPSEANAEMMPRRSQEDTKLMRLFSVPKDEDMTSSRIPREALYKAVIAQESGGKADAVSNVGAQGLMQVMPATAKDIAKELGIKEYNLKDPETNKKFGQYYLDKLLNMFGGDEGLALTAYHSGPGKVRQLLKKSGGSSLEDILSVPFDKGGLGPVGRKYAKQTLARIKTDTALV